MTVKNNKKIYGFKVLILWKTYKYCESQRILFKHHLDYELLRNFTWLNSIILVEDLIRWKRGFEMFLIDHYADDIGSKNIAGKY